MESSFNTDKGKPTNSNSEASSSSMVSGEFKCLMSDTTLSFNAEDLGDKVKRDPKQQVTSLLKHLASFWLDTLEVFTIHSFVKNANMADLPQSIKNMATSARICLVNLEFDASSTDDMKAWFDIYRARLQYPWQDNLSQELEQKLPDIHNRPQQIRKSMKQQLEMDFLTLYLRFKVTVVVLSVFALVQLLQNSMVLSSLEFLLLTVIPVAIVQTIKRRQVQVSIYLIQADFIITAWLLIQKTSSPVLDQNQVKMMLYCFLTLWAHTYLALQSRSCHLAMTFLGVQKSVILGHLVYLMVIFIFLQLSPLFNTFFLLSCAFAYIQGYLSSDHMIKLIDENIDNMDQMKQNEHFIAGIVHDLRGPISCIKMFLETLEIQLPQAVLTQSFKKSIRSCLMSSAHVFQMVGNILDLSKLKEKKFELVSRSENIEQLVKDAVDLHQTKVEQKGIQIQVYRNSTTEFPTFMQIDACRMSQILINLISNAVKFTSKGKIKIILKWQHRSPKVNLSQCSFGSGLTQKLTVTNSVTSVLSAEPWYSTAINNQVLDVNYNTSQPLSSIHQTSKPKSNSSFKNSSVNSQQNESQLQLSEKSVKIKTVKTEGLPKISYLSEPPSSVQQEALPEEESKVAHQKKQEPEKAVVSSLRFGSKSFQQPVFKSSNASIADSVIQTPIPYLSSVMEPEDNHVDQSANSLSRLHQMLQPYAEGQQQHPVQNSVLEKVEEDESENESCNNEDAMNEKLTSFDYKQADQVLRQVVPISKSQDTNFKLIRQSSIPLTDSQKRVFIEAQNNQEAIKDPPKVIQRIDAQILRVEIAGTMGETGSNMEIDSVDCSIKGDRSNNLIVEIKQDNKFGTLSGASIISQVEKNQKDDASFVSMLDMLQSQQSVVAENQNQPVQVQTQQVPQSGLREQKNAFGKSVFGAYSFARNDQKDKKQVRKKLSFVTPPISTGQLQIIKGSTDSRRQSEPQRKVLEPEPQHQNPESSTDALQRFRQDVQVKRVDLSSQNSASGNPFQAKTIKVRHPLRARSKSITLPNFKSQESKQFPISRLNNYDPTLKKHRGSIVSMQSSLHSIEEDEYDDKGGNQELKSSSNENNQSKIMNQQSGRSSSFRRSIMALEQKMEIPVVKPIQINNIINFGHGRRNNLVKVAEEISQKARAKSVIVLDQDEHLKMFHKQCEKKPEPFQMPKMLSNKISEDKLRHQSSELLNSSFQQSELTDESQDSQKNKKSVFSLSYSFKDEVAKASMKAQEVHPAINRRARARMPSTKVLPTSELVSQHSPHVSMVSGIDTENKSSKPSRVSFEPTVALHSQNSYETQEGLLTIEVIDQGIGISQQDQDKLFKPFNQANGNVSRDFGGTGLGLWISKQMATLMNGDLTLYSAGENKGSTFTFTLPTQARRAPQSISDFQSYNDIESQQSRIPQNHKVLVISDDVTLQVLRSEFCIYSKQTTVQKINHSTLSQFKPRPRTTYMFFFDQNTEVNILQLLVDIKNQKMTTDQDEILLIQMKHQIQESSLKKRSRSSDLVVGFQQAIDFSILKGDMHAEIKQIIDQVYGPGFNHERRDTMKSISGFLHLTKPPITRHMSGNIQIDRFNNQDTPQFSLSTRLFPTQSRKSQQLSPVEMRSLKMAQKKPRQHSSDLETYKSKDQQSTLSIAEIIDSRLVTQNQFTPVTNLPAKSNVLIIVDDDEFVRMSTQQSLMIHSSQHLQGYMKKKIENGEKRNKSAQEILSKIVIPTIYHVEASSGEEAIQICKVLIEQQCKIDLILMDINMGAEHMLGYEAAKQIRLLELQAKGTSHGSAIIVGHSGGDADSLWENKKVNCFMNGCRDKPLDLKTTQKLVRAINCNQTNIQIRRDKILQALVKQIVA